MPAPSEKQTSRSVTPFPDVYGFILWISIRVGGVLYLMWALIPDWVWHSHGITYYPSRLWSISVPTYFCVSWWCLVIGYVGYNYYKTNSWDSIHTIKDGFAECQMEAHKADLKQMEHSILWNKRHNKKKQRKRKSNNIVPPVPNCCDLDIKHVNALLFDNLTLK
eukprot:46575_1